MTIEEIKVTSGILIIAGSETTATLLSGLTYLLLENPETLAKAVGEVRNTFVHASDITFATVATQMPYLNACIEEGLRLYPLVLSVLPRRTGPGGDLINGRFVPPHVSNLYIEGIQSLTDLKNEDSRRCPPLECLPFCE